MRRHNSSMDSVNTSFGDVMNRKTAISYVEIHEAATSHLHEVTTFCVGGGNVATRLRQLFRKHANFILTGFDFINRKYERVKDLQLLHTYGFLLTCLNVFTPILDRSNKVELYNKWSVHIRVWLGFEEFSIVRDQIRAFMRSLCPASESVVPALDMMMSHGIGMCHSPLGVIDVLLAYVHCLSMSDRAEDISELSDVIVELDPLLKVYDIDFVRGSWLVKHMMQIIQSDDHENDAQLVGVTLVQHARVCKGAEMLQLGLTIVLKKERLFLLQVLRHLALKYPVEHGNRQAKNDLDAYMIQLKSYEKSGYLQPTICINIESIISYCKFEDILRDRSPSLLPAMNLIAKAGTLREKGSIDCLENLDRAISMMCEFNVNNNGNGLLSFMRAQASSLRALCHHVERDSSFKDFIKVVDEALELCSMIDFGVEDECILHYTTKLFIFAFDVLITEHTEDCHSLLEKILFFLEKSDTKVVGMLWQFKSHHSHLKSEKFHNQLQSGKIQFSSTNYEDLINEGKSTEDLEGIVSDISKEVCWSLESSCLAAQICYDLGERMLLMGDMNKALRYAREGCNLRHRIIKESYVPPNNESGESAHALLMNPIAAALVWSLTAEDFILAPNINVICYLMSMHQEATILELMGNGTEALKILNEGKTLSSQRGSSFLAGRFHVGIGKIHRKSQDFELAREEVKRAKILCSRITCRRCKLLLQVEIGKESTKHERMGLCSRDTEYESAPAELQNDLNNGCKCWEHSCGFSLLSFLTEKGKDYIFKDDTRNAETVFLENINLVVSLSLPSSQSQTKFSTLDGFFEFIETSKTKFSYVTHIALIIYMISWAAYKISINRRNECDDPFSIPIKKLIPSLKRALILSSEVPELFEKVAQLLALMYFFSHNEIPSSKNITHYEWTSFYHGLTVNSGVNYSFSERLRQVCGNHDPDEILHRLTHRGDADLDSFVTTFFQDLKPHTIIVISILGNKYIDLLKTKLKSFLQSDCVALMMISRFNPKSAPLVGLFPVNSGSVQKSGESSRGPWGTNTIVDTIAPELKAIVNDFDSPSPDALKTIDGRYFNLMSLMESWFGGHRYVLLGEPVGGLMSGFIGIGVNNERAPVILVLDKNIQMLPWERMEASKEQEFYRMPSVSSTFYTCYKSGKHTKGDSAFCACLNPFHAYYVINPDKSLNTEQCDDESGLANYFQGFNLQGSLWEHNGDVILEKLKTCDLFVYSGHCNGLKYIPEHGAALAKLKGCAAASLMGCMSGLLTLHGPYNPTGAILDYLLAGSPIVIGNLGKVYPSWALFLYGHFLSNCWYEMGIRRRVGIASCLVGARNIASDQGLMFAGNTVCYGVPTLIGHPV